MTSKKPSRPARKRAQSSEDAESLLNPGSAEKRRGFNPRTLDRAVIAIPLLQEFKLEERAPKKEGEPPKMYNVVIDLHLEYPGGREKARKRVETLIGELPLRSDRAPLQHSSQYLFASLQQSEIKKLVELDQEARSSKAPDRRVAIFRIWPDFPIHALIVKSGSTVKADAAHSSFAAFGDNIVWAVVDSGVQKNHVHFRQHKNLVLDARLKHYDFTEGDPDDDESGQRALEDKAGHGTHVAGIIAGAFAPKKKGSVRAAAYRWTEDGDNKASIEEHDSITGMAPKCKIVSLKVLDDDGNGSAFKCIRALDRIQEINGYGRRILIHGVNLSVGYDFQPEWFACGQSPLCVEVDRLVRSGVVVVVAAGNTGFGVVTSKSLGNVQSGLALSINDPGNAELAITVGSTHRDMPFTYGVSYFSSKGPTGDGRPKPDLLAPGEKILSCAAGQHKKDASEGVSEKFDYVEQSGTSMAAPHVSGVIAAFLSIRREFIGQPEKVKQLFVNSATDLRRDRYFQGSGLVDLMRAIQTV